MILKLIPFVKDDDVIKYLNCISERKFEPEDLYYQRMKDFFLPLDNCAEKLYQYIINLDFHITIQNFNSIT